MYRNYIQKKEFCSQPPIRLWVEITNYCNLECVFCPSNKIPTYQKGFMSMETFQTIVDQISIFGSDIVFHIGGEPTLHPKLGKMIKLANEKGLFTLLNTNATLLSEEKIKEILDSGLDQIELSLDTFKKDIYNKLRKGAKYDITFENIIRFLEIREKMKKSKTKVKIRLLDHYSNKNEKCPPTLKKFTNVFVYTHPLHNAAGNVNISIKENKKDYAPCIQIWGGFGIKWNGNVVPCCRDYFGEYVIGNIKKQELWKIWNRKKMRELRKKIAHQKNQEIKLCRNCDVLKDKKIFGIPKKTLTTFFKEHIKFW